MKRPLQSTRSPLFRSTRPDSLIRFILFVPMQPHPFSVHPLTCNSHCVHHRRSAPDFPRRPKKNATANTTTSGAIAASLSFTSSTFPDDRPLPCAPGRPHTCRPLRANARLPARSLVRVRLGSRPSSRPCILHNTPSFTSFKCLSSIRSSYLTTLGLWRALLHGY